MLGRFLADLQNPTLPKEKRIEALRWVVHLVGDLHQPLHVGRAGDIGGNAIKTVWFGEPTNLHSIWDDGLIDHTKLSFSELAASIDTASEQDISKWQSSSLMDWVNESLADRTAAYTVPGTDLAASYRYEYENTALLQRRLLQGGLRLAGLLNRLYAHGDPGQTVLPFANVAAKGQGVSAAAKPCKDDFCVRDSLDSLIWMQTSVEYRALAESAYRQAHHDARSRTGGIPNGPQFRGRRSG